jgi:hypothetical protein
MLPTNRHNMMPVDQTARSVRPDDAALRAAIVNVADYFLRMAAGKTPAEMKAIIWQYSVDGVARGEPSAAFASLILELASQVVGHQNWVTVGTSYPWPLHRWADVRVDADLDSPGIISVLQDAQALGRWHPVGDGYTPRPGDWVLVDGHVEVVTHYSGGVLSAIGASSPNYSVNAHRYASPLAAQGVDGFVNNSCHPSSGAQTSYPPAPAIPGITPPAPLRVAAGHADGNPVIPGLAVPAPRRQEPPRMPGSTAFATSAAHPGDDRRYQDPAQRQAHRRQEHSSRGAQPSLPAAEVERWAELSVTYVVLPVVTGLIAEAVFDRLTRSLKTGQRTAFRFCVLRDDGTVIDARVDTDDRETLRRALRAIDRLVNPKQLYEWDDREHDWVPGLRLPQPPVADLKSAIRNALARDGCMPEDLAWYLGISEKHCSEVLTGKATGTLELLERMAAAVGLSVELTRDGSPFRHAR